MSCKTAVVLCLGILLVWSAGTAADKSAVRIERLGDISQKDLILAPSLATADTCYVSDNGPLIYEIDYWVVGFELYKSLMNPANQCDGPYPFTVMAVNMPMGFDKATTLTVSVDIEGIDSASVPGCPGPGLILALSSDWTVSIPSAGYYNIWIPLDTPTAVNGPFYAGFYIGNAVDTAAHVALLTDTVPVPCTTYNIWDEDIGWVDLTNNDIYDFPGRLAMFVAGNPGGNPPTTSDLQIVSPNTDDVLNGRSELWAWDRTVSGTVEYVMFEYSNGGAFTEIGRDFEGTSPNRNGVSPAASGNAFSVTWDFSALPEGAYTLRATQVPTSGDPTSTSVGVYLEPTPPVARITSPFPGDPFCLPINIYMNCPDDDLSFVEVDRRQAATIYSIGVTPVNQSTVGDTDGDPTDGNHISQGEYGEYYSGPVAAATAAFVWTSRGYPALTRQGNTALTAQQVAEAMATALGTRARTGTYDEAMLTGLRSYAAAKGGGFTFDYKRNPSYSDLRIWAEDEGRVVMLGLGGSPGLWVTVDGFAAWLRPDSTFSVSVANPLTGSIQDLSWRNRPGYSEVSISGIWHRVETMVSMLASAYNVTRTPIGADLLGADGWTVLWAGTSPIDGTYHYLRSNSEDNDGHVGSHTILVQNNCAAAYVHGDYTGDRQVDFSDLYLLRDFISAGGPAPTGGAARADCNCDNVVNIADIIYYMNYLYGQASPPCR